MTPALIVGILCIVAALAFVLAPLLWPERFGVRRAAPAPAGGSLERLRDDLYARIVDLDFDHEVGKTDEEEYRRERADLKRQALAVLRLLDERAAEADGLDETADAVEREVLAARERRRGTVTTVEIEEVVAGETCAHCGRALGPDDHFCAGCGRPREAALVAAALPDDDLDGALADEIEREISALRRERAAAAPGEPRVVRVSNGRRPRDSRPTR
ncbi:MAG TPA: hypothetical protein VFL91_11340 [Thermomicrobiales bacterium]|nr:hypothetical protein [Thermomicrobiales bacterium]